MAHSDVLSLATRLFSQHVKEDGERLQGRDFFENATLSELERQSVSSVGSFDFCGSYKDALYHAMVRFPAARAVVSCHRVSRGDGAFYPAAPGAYFFDIWRRCRRYHGPLTWPGLAPVVLAVLLQHERLEGPVGDAWHAGQTGYGVAGNDLFNWQ